MRDENCTISSEAPLTVKESSDIATEETDNGPLYRAGGDGTLVTGTRAHYNGDSFKVTIRVPEVLYVESSLPKLVRPDNLAPITTAAEFERALSVLENKLEDIGIEADLFGGKISRIDICRNIATDSPLSSYRQALREVTFPRTNRRSWNGKNVKWGKNTYRELLLYDKGDREDLDTNRLQRLEYRLKKPRGVRQHLGPETPSELTGSFGAISESFRSAVKKLLPAPSSTQEDAAKLNQNGIEAALRALEDRSMQVSDTLHAVALRYLRESGDLDAFHQAVRNRKDRQAVRRYRKKFEELGPVADLLSEKETTATEMKMELREKLLA